MCDSGRLPGLRAACTAHRNDDKGVFKACICDGELSGQVRSLTRQALLQ